MDLFFWIFVILMVYLLALVSVAHLAVERWGARSGLFGSGLVTMFMGFIVHEILQNGVAVGGYWCDWHGDPSVLYYILSFGFLILGLSGVAMMAVDVMLAVYEQSERWAWKEMAESETEQPEAKTQAAPQGKIPAWKKVEMEERQ